MRAGRVAYPARNANITVTSPCARGWAECRAGDTPSCAFSPCKRRGACAASMRAVEVVAPARRAGEQPAGAAPRTTRLQPCLPQHLELTWQEDELGHVRAGG